MPVLDDTSSTPPDTTVGPTDPDPLDSNSVLLRAVGIDPIPPGATAASLTLRLDGLVTEACALGWISEAALCTQLHGNLTAGNLTQFKALVTAARGTTVHDNAFWLLTVNADYIIDRALSAH